MSTPVITNQWAGTFDCGTCRRKRLMGEEFSKKALDRHRKTGGPLKCKKCVAASEYAERDAAAAKKKKNQQQQLDKSSNGSDSDKETRKCSLCTKDLPQSAYTRNQWFKGEGKCRCRECVEKALEEESASQAKSKSNKIEDAKKNVQEAKAGGNPAKIVAAESELAALEAERVTGLKPVKLSSGRGGRGRGPGSRGRFSSGGRGRGRVGGRK